MLPVGIRFYATCSLSVLGWAAIFCETNKCCCAISRTSKRFAQLPQTSRENMTYTCMGKKEKKVGSGSSEGKRQNFQRLIATPASTNTTEPRVGCTSSEWCYHDHVDIKWTGCRAAPKYAGEMFQTGDIRQHIHEMSILFFLHLYSLFSLVQNVHHKNMKEKRYIPFKSYEGGMGYTSVVPLKSEVFFLFLFLRSSLLMCPGEHPHPTPLSPIFLFMLTIPRCELHSAKN